MQFTIFKYSLFFRGFVSPSTSFLPRVSAGPTSHLFFRGVRTDNIWTALGQTRWAAGPEAKPPEKPPRTRFVARLNIPPLTPANWSLNGVREEESIFLGICVQRHRQMIPTILRMFETLDNNVVDYRTPVNPFFQKTDRVAKSLFFACRRSR